MSLTITVDTSCEAIVDHRIENGMVSGYLPYYRNDTFPVGISCEENEWKAKMDLTILRELLLLYFKEIFYELFFGILLFISV